MKTRRLILLFMLAMPLYSTLKAQSETQDEFVCVDIQNDPVLNVRPKKSSSNTSTKVSVTQDIINRYLHSLNENLSVVNEHILYDANGSPHYRYDIAYKGVLIDGYHYTIHSAADTLNTITGMRLFKQDISVSPSITAEQAINAAKQAVQADKYIWECDEYEVCLKQTSSDISASRYPTPELVIHKSLNVAPILAYKMNITAYEPYLSYKVFISAYDGTLLEKRNNLRNSQAVGTAYIKNFGNQSINTTRENNGMYILFDQVRNIKTYDACEKFPNIATPPIVYSDNDNDWTQTEHPISFVNSKNGVLLTHWAVGKSYDFFKQKFGRNGHSNNNALLSAYANVGGGFEDNAYWLGNNTMFIGAGFGSDIMNLAALDVVAHEYGHAVTEYTANLIYNAESGAINESYSDIWAACIENYVGGRSHNQIWKLGDDLSFIIRDMSNPNSMSQPDTYQGLHWANTNTVHNDIVHTNSGVMNYWFYLLVNGGSGRNDKNNQYSVAGIGFDKAMKIAYNALTLYMTQSTNFINARTCTMNAAKNLYGDNSQEYIAVINAWYAVGVGANTIPNRIIGDYGICDGGTYFVDNLPPGATITWSSDTYRELVGMQYQDRSKLTFTSGQNTPAVTVKRSLKFMQSISFDNYYNGNVAIYATIVYNGQTIRLSKNLFANNEVYEIKHYMNSSILIMPPIRFYVENIEPNHLSWIVNVPLFGTKTFTGVNEITITQYGSGTMSVSVTDAGGCSDGNNANKSIRVIGGYIIIPTFKNPATSGETITLSVYKNNAGNSGISKFNSSNERKEPYDGDYTIELWSELYGLVKTIDADTPTIDLSLSGVPPGTYFIRIITNGIMAGTHQLIIL